jgi:hypothetical protein
MMQANKLPWESNKHMESPELRKSEASGRPGCINFYIGVAVLGAFLLVLLGFSRFVGDATFFSTPNTGSSILAIVIGAGLAAAAVGLFMMRDWARWLVVGIHAIILVLTITAPLLSSNNESGVSDVVEVSDSTRLAVNIAISFMLNVIVIYWFSTSTEDFN